MNKLKKNISVIIICSISIFLIILSGLEKGRGAFISIPALFIVNILIIIYGMIKKMPKLVLTALILFFIAPLLAFLVFSLNFPFLTR